MTVPNDVSYSYLLEITNVINLLLHLTILRQKSLEIQLFFCRIIFCKCIKCINIIDILLLIINIIVINCIKF